MEYSSSSGSTQGSTSATSSSTEFLFHISDENKTSNPSSSTSNSSLNFNRTFSDSQPDQTDPVETEEIILSVYWKRGRLGASYFTTNEEEVYLLNDIVDIHPDFNNLKSLLMQIEYSKILTCSNVADSFIKTLTQVVSGRYAKNQGDINAASRDQMSDRLHIIPREKKDLNYDSCKRLITGHRFSFEPKMATEEEHLLFINTLIDLQKESMVISFGILLKYLKKYIPYKNLSHDELHITMIHQINLDNVMHMDEASYDALQVFHTLHHPSAFKKSEHGSGREGLSLFGIFNRCKSRIGAKRMRQIFKNPIKDIKELNSRLDAINFFCHPSHDHILKNLTDSIKKIGNVSGLLASLYRSRTKVEHWKSLYSSLYNAIIIGKICKNYSSSSHLFLKIANSITARVHEVVHCIDYIIDFEESMLQNKFTVKVGIDKTLDRKRQIYAQLPEVMEKVARIELKDLPDFITQCSLVYIPEIGYLLSVPIWKGNGTDIEEYKLQNFEVKKITLELKSFAACFCLLTSALNFYAKILVLTSSRLHKILIFYYLFSQFILNTYVYYKTPRCAELDHVLGDLIVDMCGIESKIMVALMEFIHERASDIVQVIHLIADLDCIIAMAGIASEQNYVKPILSKERKIEILKGRHPLQELCVDNFVPNDTLFEVEKGSIHILTGPNASGKSVYLKQIAVIVFLAHIGSFVPAQKATIGIFDRIFTQIHTLESISTRMSSFISDLKQMSNALYNSTPSTLIIIDEFGKGTTEIDGLAILAASLINFVDRKVNSPFILVSTHFHKLSKLLPDTPIINSQYMDYVVENNEIIYLYKIKKGTCHSSLSHLAAKSAGLSEHSVNRFLEISSLNGKQLTCNNRLKITQHMLREIKFMTDFLDGDPERQWQELLNSKKKQ